MLIYLVERVSVKDTLVRARFPQSLNQKFNVLLFEHKINNTCLLQVLQHKYTWRAKHSLAQFQTKLTSLSLERECVYMCVWERVSDSFHVNNNLATIQLEFRYKLVLNRNSEINSRSRRMKNVHSWSNHSRWKFMNASLLAKLKRVAADSRRSFNTLDLTSWHKSLRGLASSLTLNYVFQNKNRRLWSAQSRNHIRWMDDFSKSHGAVSSSNDPSMYLIV